ncbi:MAG: peptidoglycan bridge formation glycyltransferase FemA/FemB family protein [bacterium]|nr:peptidoglycan bridge formation glycyltransferase FemA/FemB family protein [bacterium]
MNLQLNNNITKENWNNFLLQNNASFLQSFEWGEFQEKLGRKIWRLAVEDNGGTLAQVLVIKKPLPLGKSYLYIPFGPCFKEGLADEQEKQAFEFLLEEIKKIAKAPAFAKASTDAKALADKSSGEGKSVYCYIEPFIQEQQMCNFYATAQKLHMKIEKPQKRIQPQQTLLIDLIPTEEQIFKSLKSKTTRYNIRFGQKAGLQFESSDIIGDREKEIFYGLAQKSAQRDGFANYDRDYFNKLFSISSQELTIKLFFAKHQDNYIAANIFIFFGKTAVHLFGGFDHEFRSLMAPYFMHWNQMLFAKNNMACEVYDFWGIDEKKWPGVTHFKRSFGGKEIEYPQGYDIVISKLWYGIFKVARKLLKR